MCKHVGVTLTISTQFLATRVLPAPSPASSPHPQFQIHTQDKAQEARALGFDVDMPEPSTRALSGGGSHSSQVPRGCSQL